MCGIEDLWGVQEEVCCVLALPCSEISEEQREGRGKGECVEASTIMEGAQSSFQWLLQGSVFVFQFFECFCVSVLRKASFLSSL